MSRLLGVKSKTEETLEFKDIVKEIRSNSDRLKFAVKLGVSLPTIYSWESGIRTPGTEALCALFRVAEPKQQRLLLEALGIEDVEQFAADILSSAGVTLTA